MRFLVTILAAVVLSLMAGGIAAVLIADWVKGDESFILVFMALGPLALLAAIVFLIAGTRSEPIRAIDRAARWQLMVLALLLFAFSLIEVWTAPMIETAFRGAQLMFAIFATCVTVVVVQWIIFRLARRRRGTPPAAPRFGRQPQ